VQHINQTFAAASAALMELMTRREGLPDMLQAFKSYFLLARGDLFTTFLELAEAELERNAADVTVTRLQSLLELGEASFWAGLLFNCASSMQPSAQNDLQLMVTHRRNRAFGPILGLVGILLLVWRYPYGRATPADVRALWS